MYGLTVEKESKPRYILQWDTDSLIFFTIACVTYFQIYQRFCCFFCLDTLSASSCGSGKHAVCCAERRERRRLPCHRAQGDLLTERIGAGSSREGWRNAWQGSQLGVRAGVRVHAQQAQEIGRTSGTGRGTCPGKSENSAPTVSETKPQTSKRKKIHTEHSRTSLGLAGTWSRIWYLYQIQMPKQRRPTCLFSGFTRGVTC